MATKRGKGGAKKIKDLSPKGRSKNVKGGNLPDDQRNINRSVGEITGQVNKTTKNLGPSISKAVQKAVHG